MKQFFCLLVLSLCSAFCFAEGNELLRLPLTEIRTGTPLPQGWSIKGGRKLEVRGNSLFFLNTGSTPDWLQLRCEIKLDPKWRELTLSGEAVVTGLVRGKEKWNTARIMPNFYDAAGKYIVNYDGAQWEKNGRFQFSRSVNIPENAVKVRYDIGFAGGSGILEMKRLSLKVSEQESDTDYAAIEREKPLLRATSSDRAELLLNGVWRFKPEIPNRSTGWGYIRVPGAWATTHSWLIPNFDLVPCPPRKANWKLAELKKCYDASYEKTIDIPAEWKGKIIELNIMRPASDAEIFLNGNSFGHIRWPYGKVNLTAGIRHGQKNAIRIRMRARPRTEMISDYTFYSPKTEKGEIYNRGLCGTVTLSMRNPVPSVEGMFIRTSVRKKILEADVELLPDGYSGNAGFTFTIRDWKTGKTIKTATFSSRLDGKKHEVRTFRIPWNDPVLWDIDNPHLYTLEVRMTTPRGTDSLRDRFGFREFRISGRDFLLNEKKIRLHPTFLGYAGGTAEILKHVFTMKRNAGFNAVEVLMNHRFDQYGSADFRKEQAAAADEFGMLHLMPTADFGDVPYGHPIPVEVANEWEKDFVKEWKILRNHPSIVSFVAGFNRFSTELQRSPLCLGNGKRLSAPYGHEKKRTDSGNRIMTIMKKYDSTRPMTSHDSSGVGDYHTSNIYLNFIPLQERDEWLSEYVKTGDRPYLAVEFGCPLTYSFMRGRVAGELYSSEPLVTEWCAIYLGTDAFRREDDSYRSDIPDLLKPTLYTGWTILPKMHNYAIVQDLLVLFIQSTFRCWRTYGLSGGIVPWGDAHGWDYPTKEVKHTVVLNRNGGDTPIVSSVEDRTYNRFSRKYINKAGETLLRNNADTLVWIAGKPENFATKDHHYFPGESMKKQIAVINDTRHDLRFDLLCEVRIDEKTIWRKSFSGSVPPAENKLLPFTVPLPENPKQGKGKILLSGTCPAGGTKVKDEFSFEVVTVPPYSGKQVHLLNPEEKSERFLKAAGIPFSGVTTIPESNDHAILIVDGKALSRKDFPWKRLHQFISGGGKALLLEAPRNVYTDRFGFRTAAHVSRRVFPIAGTVKNTALSGITAEELRDWRGAGESVPAEYGTSGEQYRRSPHRYGFHWGNNGSVSSIPLEKPHASGWTPLFENEYGLIYSPLMDLRIGKGILRLSTFDFIQRSETDPASMKLFSAILRDLENTEAVPERKTILCGASKEEKSLLTRMGLLFATDSKIPASGEDRLLIAGSGCSVDSPEFKRFLSSGGRAVILPRKSGEKNPLFEVADGIAGKTLSLPDWNVLRGVSISDFFLKTDYHGPLLRSGKAVETGAHGLIGRYRIGKGEAIFLQLIPGMVNTEKIRYMKAPMWRIMRLLSQVLVNSGGTFEKDRNFLLADKASEVPGSLIFNTGWKGRFEVKVPPVKDPNNRFTDPGNKGETQGWHKPDFNDRAWRTLGVGGHFQSFGSYFDGNGVLWYRLRFRLPAEWKGKNLRLDLGIVDDMDITYLNGHKIGETSDRTHPKSHWYEFRRYPVPSNILNYGGENVLAVRVLDNWSYGGITGIPILVPENVADRKLHFYSDDYDPNKNGDDVYIYCNW